MTEHSISKLFDREGNLMGGTVFLSREEVERFEKTGEVVIDLEK